MSQKMYKREVISSITLIRDGERVLLSTGQVFEFTEDEIAQIPAGYVSTKSVVNLDSEDADLSKLEDDNAKEPAKSAPAKKVAAKKVANADDSL